MDEIAANRYPAITIRKLLVQRVLSDEVIDADRPVLSYPCTRRPRERWYFENTVDMEKLKRLADFLIHSFVFVVRPQESGTFEDARVFFNSDRNQDKCVYGIRAAEFTAIVEEVIDDEIAYRITDPSTGRHHQHDWAWVRQKREAEEAEDRRRFADLSQAESGVGS